MSFKDYFKEQEGEEVNADAGKGIKIFFTDLSEVIQKQLMTQLMEAFNVKEDDSFANKKIMDTLGKFPLFITTGQEISKQLKFDI